MVVVAVTRLRRAAQFGMAFLRVVHFPAILDPRQPSLYVLELGGVNLVGGLRREKLFDLFLGLLHPVWGWRMRVKCLRQSARLLLLLGLDLLEECGKGLGIVPALVQVLEPEVISLGFETPAELQEGYRQGKAGRFLGS